MFRKAFQLQRWLSSRTILWYCCHCRSGSHELVKHSKNDFLMGRGDFQL